MAKKEDLKSGLESLLGGGITKPSVKVELVNDNYARTSLIVNQDKYAKLKEIAFNKNLTIKDVLEVAMDMLIEKYEKKNGTITPTPSKYKRG